MSIASELAKLIVTLATCYVKCNSKGATMPVQENMDNLPDCIDSITGGGGISQFVSNPMEAIACADESVTVEIPPSYNVTLVGGLTNNDGVLSGFSSSKYALVNQSLTVNNKSWELYYSFITNSPYNTTYPMCSDDYGFGFGVDAAYYYIYIGTGGSSWDIANGDRQYIVTQTGVKQYIRCGWTGTEYYIDRSLDGETYTRVYTKSSTTSMGTTTFKFGVSRSNAAPLNGTVDLNDCKLYHDGILIWEGVTRQSV